MVSAGILTSWGYSVSEPSAPHALIAASTTWEIYRRADNNFVAFAKQGPITRRSLKSTEQAARDYVAAVADPGVPVTVPPPAPPPVGPAKLDIRSSPTTANVFIDGTDTGRLSNVVLEVSPGAHTVRLEKANYEPVEFSVTAIAGQTVERTRTLTRIPAPPAPPPPAPPPEVPLAEQFKTPLTELVEALGFEPPQILKAWDGVIGWLTEHFGVEWPAFYRDEITGEIKRAPVGKKVLMFISMPAPVTAAETAVQSSITNMTAGAIQEEGLKNPAGLRKLVQALKPGQLTLLFDRLNQTAAGRSAVQVIQRITLEEAKKIAVPTWLKWLAGGVAVATIFIGFQLTDAIFGLRKSKVLPPLQSEELRDLSIAANNLVGSLETIKFSCDKDSFDKVLAEIPEMNRKWDDLIKYARENPLSPDQIAAFAENVAAYIGIMPPRTSDAMLATIEGAKKQFTINAEVEVRAIQEKCAWTPEEAEEKAYGTVILKTEPGEVLIRVAGEEKKAVSGESLRLLAGSHDILVEAEGYQPRRRTIIVKAGEALTESFILEKVPEAIEPGAGRLQVLVYDDTTGAPITATLLIDGRVEPYTTHSFVLDLAPDAYEVRIEKAGYDFYKDTIIIAKGKITPIVARLKAIPELILPPIEPPPEEIVPEVPKKGVVEIVANVTAEIWTLEGFTGKTTPARLELTPGSTSITLKAEGYISDTFTAYPTLEVLRRYERTLRAEEAPPAIRKLWKLNVDSEPKSAKILINFDFTGKYTPDFVYLLPGQYIVSIVKSGYKRYNEAKILEEI